VALRDGAVYLFVCSFICLSPRAYWLSSSNRVAAATEGVTDVFPTPVENFQLL